MDNKLKIARRIHELDKEGKPACMSVLKELTGLTTPTISAMLKEMRKDALVASRKKGRNRYYTLTKKGKRWASLLQEASNIHDIWGND